MGVYSGHVVVSNSGSDSWDPSHRVDSYPDGKFCAMGGLCLPIASSAWQEISHAFTRSKRDTDGPSTRRIVQRPCILASTDAGGTSSRVSLYIHRQLLWIARELLAGDLRTCVEGIERAIYGCSKCLDFGLA